MPRTWSEGFDFYMVQFEDGPASIMLDMAAAANAPVKSHPARLIVRMKMKHPYDNGLRSSEEAQTLFKLEDAIVDALSPHDGIFVGRIVSAGNSDLFFYLPTRTERDSVEPLVRRATADYGVAVSLESDPEWTTYFEILFPESRDQQLMMNRRVCDQLRENGDRHEIPRMVDHMALFPDERSARETGEALKAAGFRVDAPNAPDPQGGHQMWAMEFHRVDALGEGRIDEVTVEILDLLEGTGAHYDGWGCAVVSASA